MSSSTLRPGSRSARTAAPANRRARARSLQVAHSARTASPHPQRRRRRLDQRRVLAEPACRPEDRRARQRGAISLSSSSHFPLMRYLEAGKTGDVAARPRQAFDEPSPTGSATRTNTIGMVRVCRSNASAAAVATMTSGASATNSAAHRRNGRDRRRPADTRSGYCGPRSSPARCKPCSKRRDALAPIRIVVSEPAARRCAAYARPAARAPQAATPPPRRRAA